MTNQTQEQKFKSYFKEWNANQKRLRPLLGDPEHHEEAVDLFLQHHAVLHARQMSGTEPSGTEASVPEAWSFEDAVLDGMSK